MIRDIHYCYLIKPYESSAWKWNKKCLLGTDIYKFGMSSERAYKDETCLARMNAYDPNGTEVIGIWEFDTREETSQFEKLIIPYLLGNFDGVEGTREYFHCPYRSSLRNEDDEEGADLDDIIKHIDSECQEQTKGSRSDKLRTSHRLWQLKRFLHLTDTKREASLYNYGLKVYQSRDYYMNRINEKFFLDLFKQPKVEEKVSLTESLEEYRELVDTLRHQNEELHKKNLELEQTIQDQVDRRKMSECSYDVLDEQYEEALSMIGILSTFVDDISSKGSILERLPKIRREGSEMVLRQLMGDVGQFIDNYHEKIGMFKEEYNKIINRT